MSSMMLRVPATRYEGLENPDEGRDRGNKSFDVVDVVLASLSRRLFFVIFRAASPHRGARFSRETRCAHADSARVRFDPRGDLEQKNGEQELTCLINQFDFPLFAGSLRRRRNRRPLPLAAPPSSPSAPRYDRFFSFSDRQRECSPDAEHAQRRVPHRFSIQERYIWNRRDQVKRKKNRASRTKQKTKRRNLFFPRPPTSRGPLLGSSCRVAPSRPRRCCCSLRARPLKCRALSARDAAGLDSSRSSPYAPLAPLIPSSTSTPTGKKTNAQRKKQKSSRPTRKPPSSPSAPSSPAPPPPSPSTRRTSRTPCGPRRQLPRPTPPRPRRKPRASPSSTRRTFGSLSRRTLDPPSSLSTSTPPGAALASS